MKEGKLYLVFNDKKAFFTSADHYRGYKLSSCQNVYDALSFLLDIFYLRLRMSVRPCYTDKLLGVRWVQIVLLL